LCPDGGVNALLSAKHVMLNEQFTPNTWGSLPLIYLGLYYFNIKDITGLIFASLTKVDLALIYLQEQSMNFLCTVASFTVAIKSRGLNVLCQLTSSLRLQDVLVHQLAFFIYRGASSLTAMDGENADIAGAIYLSFRPSLTDKSLPFASS
jgi:hypothetical protein